MYRPAILTEHKLRKERHENESIKTAAAIRIMPFLWIL